MQRSGWYAVFTRTVDGQQSRGAAFLGGKAASDAVPALRPFAKTVRGAVLCVLAMLAALPACAAPGKTPAAVVDLRQHPTGGRTPVEVAVGLYITNLVAIDETRESFEVGGYLTARWLDPRLALAKDQADAPRRGTSGWRSSGLRRSRRLIPFRTGRVSTFCPPTGTAW